MDNLIIVRTHGTRPSLYPLWMDGDPERNWDLYISPYSERPTVVESPINNMPGYFDRSTSVAKTIIGDVLPGLKWIGLRELLRAWPDWLSYKYIMLADDDLFAMPGTWSKFFDRAAKYGAKISSPALTEDSFFSFPFTIRNTEFIARRVSYVEMMAPCFRIDVLSELLSTFNMATEMGNGWGLDYLWAMRLGHKDLFYIDETPVTHSRKNSITPERYEAGQAEQLRISGIEFKDWRQKSYAGIEANGNEIPESDGRFLDRLIRGYTTLFARDTSGQNPIRDMRKSIESHQRRATPPPPRIMQQRPPGPRA